MSNESIKMHRRKFLTVRVTKGEKSIIEDNAQKHGTDVSTFVRELALQGRVEEDSSSEKS